jgi:hypothetical protein
MIHTIWNDILPYTVLDEWQSTQTFEHIKISKRFASFRASFQDAARMIICILVRRAASLGVVHDVKVDL